MSQEHPNYLKFVEDLRNTNQESASEENSAVGNLQRQMSENFLNIFTTLAYIVQADSLNHSMLVTLTDRANSQRTHNSLEKQRSNQPVTSTPANSASTSHESKEIRCYDCGKVFVRGSLTDSISKHVKETDCKPYPCPVCKKLFRVRSKMNDHARTHVSKLKRPAADTPNEDPEVKRACITSVDTEKVPLKENTSSNILPSTPSESDKSKGDDNDSDDYFLQMI